MVSTFLVVVWVGGFVVVVLFCLVVVLVDDVTGFVTGTVLVTVSVVPSGLVIFSVTVCVTVSPDSSVTVSVTVSPLSSVTSSAVSSSVKIFAVDSVGVSVLDVCLLVEQAVQTVRTKITENRIVSNFFIIILLSYFYFEIFLNNK